MKLPLCETCQTIHSKGEPCASAPLNLCPPTGVTGTALPDSETPQFKDAYGSPLFVGDKYFQGNCGTVFEISHLYLHGVDREPSVRGKAQDSENLSFVRCKEIRKIHGDKPASPVKDTPAEVCKCRKCGSVHEWSARVQSHTTFCPNCGDMMYDMIARPAPASPVDSVGVPALCVDVDSRDGTVCIVTDEEEPEFLFEACKRFPKGLDPQTIAESLVGAHASHAAKDAKIKALEDALVKIAHNQVGPSGRTNYGAADYWQDQCISMSEVARAALALPCAPQES